jgi:hypothetical protein
VTGRGASWVGRWQWVSSGCYFFFLVPQVDFFLGFFFAAQPQVLHMFEFSFQSVTDVPTLPRPLGDGPLSRGGWWGQGERGKGTKEMIVALPLRWAQVCLRPGRNAAFQAASGCQQDTGVTRCPESWTAASLVCGGWGRLHGVWKAATMGARGGGEGASDGGSEGVCVGCASDS